MGSIVKVQVTDKEGLNHDMVGNLTVSNSGGIVEIYNKTKLIALFTGPIAVTVTEDRGDDI